MKIRAYTQGDLPAIFDIYNRSKLEELKFEKNIFILLPLEKDKVRLSALMESKIFVYQKQDQIYGYGAFYGNEIRALFVHPECRRKGVGKTLIEFLLSNIRGEVCLYVASTNEPAKRLYEKYGFSVIDTFKTTYNQVPVIAQKMVCKISPQSIRH